VIRFVDFTITDLPSNENTYRRILVTTLNSESQICKMRVRLYLKKRRDILDDLYDRSFLFSDRDNEIHKIESGYYSMFLLTSF
jgi:hypothetical protein